AMKPHMDANQKVRLDYASKYAGIANYWKNRQGMIDALTEHKTAESKRKQEEKFSRWARAGGTQNVKSEEELEKKSSNTQSSLSQVSDDKELMNKMKKQYKVVNNYG